MNFRNTYIYIYIYIYIYYNIYIYIFDNIYLYIFIYIYNNSFLFCSAVQHERGPRNSPTQKQKLLRQKIIKSSSSFPAEDISVEAFIMKLRSSEPHLNIIPAFDDTVRNQSYLFCEPNMFSEIVARLLFKNVGWIKNLSDYLGICFNDQVIND